MSESRKRAESEIAEEGGDNEEESFSSAEKRQRIVEIGDEDYDLEEFLGEFEIEENKVNEAMKALENEIISPNIKFCSSFCSMCSFLSSSSSFVLINRNEESCGPSISNDTASVMASIHFAGINISYLLDYNGDFPVWPWPLSFPTTSSEMNVLVEDVKNEEDELAGKNVNGGDSNYLDLELTDDDEWIENFLSEISFEFED